jgi:hypothetical protein
VTLGQLYAIAASRGIEIDDVPMRGLRAVSFPEGWIAVDRRKFKNDIEYKCELAHEIGHIETGSFYNINSSIHERKLNERHANRFAAELLMPLSELRKAVHRGLLFNRILAHIFEVTLEFINMVLDLYEQELFAAARTRSLCRTVIAPFDMMSAVYVVPTRSG